MLRFYLSKLDINGFGQSNYYYGNAEILQGKRIILYGAGTVGRGYYTQISRYTHCEIVAWVDAQPDKYHYPYIDVYGTETIGRAKFDMLLIAVASEKVANEIKAQLVQQGIELDKIYWSKPLK